MREEFEEKGINPRKQPRLKNMMSQMTNPFPSNMKPQGDLGTATIIF